MSNRSLQDRSVIRWISPRLQAVLLVAPTSLFVGCEKKEAAPPPPPPVVKVADVVQQDVPVYSEWVAQLNGDINAEITPKVQGYVLTKNYQEGYPVSKGQLLFSIDPRPFQTALDQARAQQAGAEAELMKAQTDLARDTPLAAQSAIPQKNVDNDKAAVDAGIAAVNAGKAAVEQARLNLDWTKVFSPIDGIAGLANSQVGDLVGPTTKMTTVSTVNPIRAYFSISENAYLRNADRIAAVLSGSRSHAPVAVEFIQADELPYKGTGRIILVNREVSSQTGTIQFAAEFSNPQAVLRPGGYGKVRIKTAENLNAILVPQIAVIEVQSAYQVAVVSPDNKVSFRPVKVGDRVGNNWVITEGVKPGERVISEGYQRVRDGMTVNVEPQTQTASAEGK